MPPLPGVRHNVRIEALQTTSVRRTLDSSESQQAYSRGGDTALFVPFSVQNKTLWICSRTLLLMVLSQPFLRKRHAVHVATLTCSSHRERLLSNGPVMGASCRSIQFSHHILPADERSPY